MASKPVPSDIPFPEDKGSKGRRRDQSGARSGSKRGGKKPAATTEVENGPYVWRPIVQQVHGAEEKEDKGELNPKRKQYKPKGIKEAPKDDDIPAGAHVGLVCKTCMTKYSKKKTTTTKTETKTVVAMIQLSGGARPTAPRVETTTETKTTVEPFRRCMKCAVETAKELPPEEDNKAWICKKCTSAPGNGAFNCVSCKIVVGGYAGSGGARLCNRHADPPRCFRCGLPG